MTSNDWEPQRVSLGPCQCPGTPHDEDEAWVSPGKAFANAVLPKVENVTAMDLIDFLAAAGRDGLTAWNLLDARGARVPLDDLANFDDERLAPIAAWLQAYLAERAAAIYWRVGIALKEGEDGGGTAS